MPDIHCNGSRIDLGPSEFVARGGQASVFARGSTAYKIFADPAQAPPTAKLTQLRALGCEGVLAPHHPATDGTGRLVGFSMPFLDGWHPLVRLFAPAYQQRCGLDEPTLGRLVLSLRARVQHAHDHGALIVDLNELNVLVRPDHQTVAVIDVDSWQLPGFPATALAESIRDRKSAGFDTGTDWFAFAILSFQLFVGIHPFKGRHPTLKGLDARMKAEVSVFHPDVVLPPMADLSRLPGVWRDWYTSLFVHGERTPSPTDLTTPVARTPRMLPGASIEVAKSPRMASPIQGTASWGGHTWSWTRDGVFDGQRRVGPTPPSDALPVASPDGIAFILPGPHLTLQTADGRVSPTSLSFESLTAHRGAVHGRSGATLVELTVSHIAGAPMLVPRVAARIAPNATRLYRGCAVTTVLGSTFLHRLGEGSCASARIEALEGKTIIDANHRHGITVIITWDGGHGERHVLTTAGIRTTTTQVPAAELLVLPSGVAVITTDTGIELFHTHAPGTIRAVEVDLPGPLVPLSGRPGVVLGDRLATLTLKR